MAGIAPTTRAELSQRRKQLRRQRRAQKLRATLRFMVVSGLAAGALWTLQQPTWVIQNANQLRIEGNRYLSDQTIRKLVPLKYPQSIFRTQPHAIAQHLKQKAPLSYVQVDRQLFPPELVVRVREQPPVAAVHSKNQKNGQPQAQPDLLLDAQGNVIPIESFQSLEAGIKLPQLKVFGDPNEYRADWPKMYSTLQQQGISPTHIDWRKPSNVVLATPTGAIHLGPYEPNLFKRQLRAVVGLKNLTQKVPSQAIDYIDLRNPDAPALQKRQTASNPSESGAP